MTSEEYVRSEAPDVRVDFYRGNFIGGGKIRYDVIWRGKIIGADTRIRSAWAEAARYLKRSKS